MTWEQIVGKTVDHIFDVECEDGTVTQVPYTGVVTRIMEKNKNNQKKKHCLKLFMTVSIIIMKTATMTDNKMKEIPLNMHCFKIILKEMQYFAEISLNAQKQWWHTY